MSNRPTRRELLRAGAVSGVALAAPGLIAQTAPMADQIPEAEKPLAKPLTPELRKLLKPALEGNEGNAKNRLKHPLPENSEPCFSYRAEPRQVRSR